MSTRTSLPSAVPEPVGAARLLEAATERSLGLGAFIRLALLSGARRGELLAACWPDIPQPDVDGECGLLDIACRDGGKTKYARRRIAIDPGTMALLGKWQSENAEPDSRGPLFAGKSSGDRAWNPTWVSRQVIRAAAQAEVPATLHSLRHYPTTRMAELGVPAWVIARRLGLAPPAGRELSFVSAEAATAADRDAALLLARELSTRHLGRPVMTWRMT